MRAFLDFEASSLARNGYPIEVAWVFEDGTEESHLIRPLPGWTDWDESAQAIHGISREKLLTDGAPADFVAHRLFDALGGHDLFASSPSWDGKWLSVLLRAGGLPRHALRLRDTDVAQIETATAALAPLASGTGRDAAALVARVRGELGNPLAHRALPDAQHEQRLWIAIRDAAQAEAERAAGRG